MVNNGASGGQNSPAGCSHSDLYKNTGLNNSNFHQKHRENVIELRKQRRDDGFTKTRRRLKQHMDNDEEIQFASPFDPDLIGDLTSRDLGREISALKVYRKIFSNDEAAEQMLDLNLVAVVVDIFKRAEPYSLHESLCIAVISRLSTDFSRIGAFITPGVIAKLVNSLRESDAETVINAEYLLEAVVMLDPYTRSSCDELGLLPIALNLYQKFDRVDVRRQTLSLIGHYFHFETTVDEVKEAFTLFEFIFLNEADDILLSDTVETVAHIAKFTPEHANYIIECGIYDVLNNMSVPSGTNLKPVLNFAQSILQHGEKYARILYTTGFFDKIWMVANAPNPSEIIRARSFAVIASFVQNGLLGFDKELTLRVVPTLVKSLCKFGFDVRKQIIIVIDKLVSNGEPAAIEEAIKAGVIEPLCDLLTVMHIDTVILAIKCLDKISDYLLMTGMNLVDLRQLLLEHNAEEKMNFLMESQCYDVFKAANAFTTRYFESSDELFD